MIGRTIAHYEVLAMLGRGGTGAVYRARDLKLGRTVALKFLAADAFHESARNRLLQEAKAIAALSHPAIATLFDALEAEGETFLVLEYLPGGTLRSRIQAAAAGPGTLPVAAAAAYALQIASALAHAHRHGIIHRDVKPGNALFTAEGNLKLTDFGLARFSGGPHLTAPGSVVGTVLYMSPEQIRGIEVDARSDVFSLGVVMYEMLAGRVPFAGDNAAAALHKTLYDNPTPLRDVRADVPEQMEKIIERALEKDREMRYRGMDILVAELASFSRTLEAGSQDGLETATTLLLSTPLPAGRAGEAEDGKRRVWRRRALLSAGVAAGVGGPVLWLLWPSGKLAALPKGFSILLTDIENPTSQPELDAVSVLLRSQLGQSARFVLMDTERLRETLQRMVRPRDQRLDSRTAREVAWRNGVPVVLSGRLDQLGGRYLLSLRLEKIGRQPTEPEAAWSQTFTASSRNDLFRAIREAGRWVRQLAGEAARDLDQRDQPVEQTTTSSWQALDLFSRAEKLRAVEQMDDAILLLREAVSIDPEFALAHMRLGDLCVALRRYTEGYRHWRRAISVLPKRPLSSREELRIKALYALDTGDYVSAEQLYKAFALRYPEDLHPRFYHAMALEWLGRTDEAAAEYGSAETLEPSLHQSTAHVAMVYLAQGRFDDASRKIQRLRTLRADPWAEFIEGVSQFLQGGADAAMERFHRLAESRDPYWHSRGWGLLACVLSEMGKREEALRVLKEGMEFDAQLGRHEEEADKLLFAAGIHLQKNEPAASRETCLKALKLEASPLRVCRAGTLLARAGFPDEGRRLLASEALDYDAPYFHGARHRILGEILLSAGKTAEAIGEFLKADALEPAAGHRDYLARAYLRLPDADKAVRAHERTIRSAAFVWQAPEEDLPGLFAGALFQYGRLSYLLNRREAAGKALTRYLALAGKADPSVREPVEARRILHELDRKKTRDHGGDQP